jgi:DNA-binding NtrC family response regulator
MQLISLSLSILPVISPTQPVDPATRPCRVVVIDDDREVGQAFAWALEDMNCQVIAASHVAEALAQMKRQEFVPDAVMVDYHLDGQTSGLRAIHLIRRLFGPAIPGVIITGDISVNESIEPAAENIQWLYKPVGYSSLAAMVSEFVSAMNRSQAAVDH